MTRDEHEAKKIVAKVIVNRCLEICHGHVLLRFGVATQLLVFALEHLLPAQKIDRTILCGGHEPGPGFVGNAGGRPFLQRRDQCILRQLFGNPTSRTILVRPAMSRADSILQTASMARWVVGSRHGRRSHHQQPASATFRGEPLRLVRCPACACISLRPDAAA